MASNHVALTAIGIACIAAAGTGGYFALRENRAPAAPATTVASTTTAPAEAPAAKAEPPVQETEAAVSPATKPARSSAPKPAPAKPEKNEPRVASAPTLNRTWPTGAAQAAPPLSPAPEPPPAPARTETVERAPDPQPALPPAPPQKTYEELVVSADSVIGLQSDTTVTSETARIENRVEARVTRDVKVGDRVAIPAGARAIGFVTQVEQGGKFKERAKLAIRFQTIVLADGTRLPISTAPVEREGDAKGNSSAAKMGGGAVAGTILGAILGGGKGAAIGGMAGAGAGAAAVEAGSRSTAALRAGEPITVRLLAPVTVTTEK
jgi:type IV secretory pathway VirB10-like protein